MNNSFSPFAFDGRLGRGRFTGYILLMALIATVVLVVGLFAVAFLGDPYMSDRTIMAVGTAFNYATALLGLSYSVRRLHDLGVSGKWAIALLVPWGLLFPWVWVLWAISGIVLLIFLFAPGTDGPNGYGEGR